MKTYPQHRVYRNETSAINIDSLTCVPNEFQYPLSEPDICFYFPFLFLTKKQYIYNVLNKHSLFSTKVKKNNSTLNST